MLTSRSSRYALLLLFVCRCDCSDEGPMGNDGGSADASVGNQDTGGGTDAGGGGIDATGGGDAGGLGDGAVANCVQGLESITLSAATLMVTLDGSTASPVTFTATGRFSDGSDSELDPTSLVWAATRSDDSDPGTVVDGVFTPNPAIGGLVTITATDGCVTGSAEVQLFLEVTVGAPTNPPDFAGVPETTGSVPEIVYPSDQTRFPRNIYRTLFQWRTGGATEFRLTFEGPNAKVTVFTDGAHVLCENANPAAGCWEADELVWSFIAGSNAGEVVSFVVDGLDSSSAPPVLRRAESIEIGFSRRDVPGAIFYWSTTSAGVRRANIRDSEPEDYITGKPSTTYDDGDEVNCVACHTVSRDGKYMLAPVKSSDSEGLWVMDVTLTAPPTRAVTGIPDTKGHGFATISPDDSRVIAAWKGNMWLLDRTDGTKLGDLDLGAFKGTHPDWSPDDTQVVFATGDGDAPGGASIALLPHTPGTGQFGTPETLVPATGDRTNLFPMFSPDGAWIAFSQGKGGHGDKQAQLFLVSSATTSPMPEPIELLQANRVVSNQLTDGQHQNSQPTWAPPGDLAWIAFNSVREYGVVLGEGTQQIWVAAVDLSAAVPGVDPSYPAFRLQFQGLEENNHRAFWTLDVRDPPDGGTPADAGPDTDGGVDAGVASDAGSSDGSIDPPNDGGVSCVPRGASCDPVADTCCEGGDLCDTLDNGETYTCFLNL